MNRLEMLVEELISNQKLLQKDIKRMQSEIYRIRNNTDLNTKLIEGILSVNPHMLGGKDKVHRRLEKLILDIIIGYNRKYREDGMPFEILSERVKYSEYGKENDLSRSRLCDRIHQSLDGLEKKRVIETTHGRSNKRMIYLIFHLKELQKDK